MPARTVLIVLANPEPTSFCHALAYTGRTALEAAGHRVVLSDLYAMDFNPVAGRHDFTSVADPDRFHYQSEQAKAAREGTFVEEIRLEQDKVAAADILVAIFPLWWGGPPAILKGWFERVMAYSFAYVDGFRFDSGLFRGRRAMFAVTTGGTPARFSPEGVYGPAADVLMPVRRLAFEYMGYEVSEPFVAYAAPRVAPEAREEYLERFAAQLLDTARLPVAPVQREVHPLDLVPDDAWRKTR
ncbi:NAD(P)H-dependent oxidoreductase [Consotaella salsifontis]|uniref:NAD(P)H dehydrogenase (Quinone) n=1 Tax=Consotaella salsifontis TaxID=1365950 RepID=A0A1T4TCN6_9HYPH|nr:NAD(P)H-dependent oxidoreductase [Consotaella salsifontis]SKA38091.1 NAD(P)H dehydrogenase (quinone) [Consotaella salsifontis]